MAIPLPIYNSKQILTSAPLQYITKPEAFSGCLFYSTTQENPQNMRNFNILAPNVN